MPRSLLVAAVVLLGSAGLSALATPAAAQTGGRVEGTVVDVTTGAPVPFASVALWRQPTPPDTAATLETGAATAADGTFAIAGARPGTYTAVVRFLGYAAATSEPFTLGGDAVRLGTLALAPEATALDAVAVTAEREPVEVQIDRTVYRVADSPLADGGVATDALQTIPSVDVDVDGRVSLRGVQNVTILINGRPAPVTGAMLGVFLQSLPAGTIDRIEVMPNPSARFEPDGSGGIINLVLRDDVALGLGGAVSVGVDSQGGGTVSALVNSRRGPLALSLNAGLNRTLRGGTSDRYRLNRTFDAGTSLTQQRVGTDRGTGAQLGAALDWDASSRTSVRLSARGGLQRGVDTETTDYLQSDPAGLSTLAYTRAADEAERGLNGDLRLSLRHDFGTASAPAADGAAAPGRGGRGGRSGGRSGGGSAGPGAHSLSVEARLSGETESEAGDFAETLAADGVLRGLQRTTVDGTDGERSVAVDYARPLVTGLRLEAGYLGQRDALTSELMSETAGTDGVFVPDATLGDAFDFAQTVHAVYGQVGRQSGPLGLQAGVRAEHAATAFTLDATGERFDNQYVRLFPSAFATLRLSTATQLRAGYSRRINRPRTRDLNPFPRLDDPLYLRVGNPELRPETTDAFELGATHFTPWGSLQLTPYYRFTRDVVTRIETLRPDGVTVQTVDNLRTAASSGVEAVATLTPGGVLDDLRATVSVEGFRRVTDGTNVDDTIGANAFGWGGRLTLGYELPTGASVQANLRYRAPMATEQGRRGARTFADLAVRQPLWTPAATLTLRVRDPFGWAATGAVTDTALFYQEVESDPGIRQVGLVFTYAFGQVEREQRPDDGADFEGDE